MHSLGPNAYFGTTLRGLNLKFAPCYFDFLAYFFAQLAWNVSWRVRTTAKDCKILVAAISVPTHTNPGTRAIQLGGNLRFRHSTAQQVNYGFALLVEFV